MNAETFFNNGFGEDVETIHRNHVIELMTNFAYHFHKEQMTVNTFVVKGENLPCSQCGKPLKHHINDLKSCP